MVVLVSGIMPPPGFPPEEWSKTLQGSVARLNRALLRLARNRLTSCVEEVTFG